MGKEYQPRKEQAKVKPLPLPNGKYQVIYADRLGQAEKMTVDKDLALGNGTFFCRACLQDKEAEQRSPDSRYCQDCYDFLTEEVKLLTGTRRPSWVPKPKK